MKIPKREIGEQVAVIDFEEFLSKSVEQAIVSGDEPDYEGKTAEEVLEMMRDNATFMLDHINEAYYNVGVQFENLFESACFKVDAVNIGWQKMSGYKYVDLRNFDYKAFDEIGRKVLNTVFNYSYSYSMTCYKCDNGLYINVKHHDNPVNGDKYYLTPLTVRQLTAKKKQ
ncbi:MAG: hypothetical protein ACRCZB_03775 [Bacteroidales bacterium]